MNVVRTIAASWEEYAQASGAINHPDVARHLKQAFYAGAVDLLSLIFDALEESEENLLNRVDSIQGEFREYSKKLLRGED